MFERRRRYLTRAFLYFFHQLPAVECVQKIDVPGLTVQDLDRQIFPVFHKDTRRLLIRVAAVFQLKFFHRSFSLFILVYKYFFILAARKIRIAHIQGNLVVFVQIIP